LARLRALALAHVGVVVEDIGRASVFIHEWRSLGPERRARTLARRDAYERRFRAIIREGTDAGVFAPIDPTVAAAYLLTALNGLVTWYQPEGRLRPDAVTEAYVELTIQAVSGVAPDRSR
jgi:hypothetical protein